MSEHTDFEELEQIPWAALAAKPTDLRNRYITFGVVAVVTLLVVAWLVLRGGGATAASPPTTAALAVAVTAPPMSTTTVAPSVYSEADLMAINATGEERLALMQAEWLVRDLFTVDADPDVTGRIDALLPGVTRSETGAYVEWVIPYAVTADPPGSYRVELVYRLLTQTEEGFSRQPAEAVAVDLSIDVDGTARLEAEPEAISVPVLLGLTE